MSKRKNKPYEELCFTDDFMFNKIMTTEPEICKKIIELSIGKKVSKISYTTTQKSVKIKADGKGVRFDIYVEGDDNTIYNVEMQVTNIKELSKRIRYYQGMIDLNTIEQGGTYKDLKNTYIIFLCTFDPFDHGITRYTFEQMCHEVNGLTMGDDAKVILINPFGQQDHMTEDEDAFFAYLRGVVLDLPFAQTLENSVQKARLHEEWKVEYMSLLLHDQEKIEEGKLEVLENLLKYENFSVERLALITGLSEEQIKEEMQKRHG